ncbi:MAG TPA: YggS family pyridoxal phosphate-dependent enzyme [Acidimicrobiales bacterium]
MGVLRPDRLQERVVTALAGVRERIERAGGGSDVAVLAVTKGFGPEAIEAAVAAGCTLIGESYAQELLGKLHDLGGAAGLSGHRAEIHFIGRLQSRKVKDLVGVVDVWQSIDRASLIDELARRATAAGLPARVMVQVNVSDEPQKGGCLPSEAAGLVARARAAGLTVEGLMTVGLMGPPELARPGFRTLRALATDLGVRHCSMGMSEDLEVAVAEGSTMVRVGTALFGDRPPPIDPPK